MISLYSFNRVVHVIDTQYLASYIENNLKIFRQRITGFRALKLLPHSIGDTKTREARACGILCIGRHSNQIRL